MSPRAPELAFVLHRASGTVRYRVEDDGLHEQWERTGAARVIPFDRITDVAVFGASPRRSARLTVTGGPIVLLRSRSFPRGADAPDHAAELDALLRALFVRLPPSTTLRLASPIASAVAAIAILWGMGLLALGLFALGSGDTLRHPIGAFVIAFGLCVAGALMWRRGRGERFTADRLPAAFFGPSPA